MRFLIPKLGMNQIYLDYEPADRLFGSSKYSFRKMYNFATYSMVTTTNNLLRLSLKASFAYALFSMAVFIYGLTILISGNGIPGYLSLLFTLTISFSGLFLVLGIFGLYLEKLLDSASRIRIDIRSKIEQIVGD
jgi:dolichol-phosphate mannosyltransferase